MANRGPTGDTGTPASNSISKGNGLGQTNLTKDVIRLVSLADLGKYASYTQASMLLHQAELGYLNKQYAETASRLNWLCGLTSGDAGVNAISEKYFKILNSKLNFGTPDEWKSLHSRAVLLRNQMESGLDFFGLPDNFVPMIKLNAYQNRFKPMFDAAKDVETKFNEFNAASLKSNGVKNEFDDFVNKAQDFIQSLENELDQASQTADHLQDDVATLWLALDSLRNDMEGAEASFKTAVENKASGCTFADIIRLASSVIAISQASLSAFNSIKDAASDAKDVVNSFENNNISLLDLSSDSAKNARKDLIDKISHLKTDGASLQSAATQLKSAFEAAGNNESASDTIKFTMDKEEFDKQIQPYLDLPEAQHYQELVHKYIDTATARNQKMLDYTATVLREQSLIVTIAQKKQDLQSANDKMARSVDILIADRDLVLKSTLQEVKNCLLRQLFMANRALNYWALDTKELKYNDSTVAELESSWAAILNKELDYYQNRNLANLTFPHDESQNGFPVIINKDDDPIGFTKFIKTGRLLFRIQKGVNDFQFSPKGMAAVCVRDVEIKIDGIKSSDGEISVLLTHHGNASFLTPDGKTIQFNHPSRSLRQVYAIDPYQVKTGTNLAEIDTNYADLSLYALWSIDVSNEFNPNADRSGINKIELSFRGTFLPSI